MTVTNAGYASVIRCVFCSEFEDTSTMKYGTVFGKTGLICVECYEYEDFRADVKGTQVSEWDDDKWNDDEFTANVTGLVGKDVKKTIKFEWCKHHLTPFLVSPGVTVYLSGSRHLKDAPQAALPEAGMYLDHSWGDGDLYSNDGLDLTVEGALPTLFVNWPDFGDIPVPNFSRALAWAVTKIREGKTLEIGCMGGHGRTGTVAAGLAVVYGVGAREAIDLVRKSYCTLAIENKTQEDLLFDFEDALRKKTEVVEWTSK